MTKLRTLYMVGQTRVHVDHVYELDGDFMELEVGVRAGGETALVQNIFGKEEFGSYDQSVGCV